MKYFRLTRDERYQIFVLLKSGSSKRQIAQLLKRSPSTISREVKRNRGGSGYGPSRANSLARRRRQSICPQFRIIGALEKQVISRLSEQWSPEQISGRFRLDGVRLAPETIYKYIYRQKKLGKNLYTNLRYGRPRRWTQIGRRNLRKSANHWGQVYIDDRAEIVEERTRLGDFERDTIRGPNQKGPRILTIVDRVSRLTKIDKMPHLSARITHHTTLRLLKKMRVETITNDNGQEFALHRETSAKLRAKIFFNHPYSSWQRGTNENTNGLIRQYIPKGSDLSLFTKHFVKTIETKLNNRPRKCLGYRTPLEVQRALSQKRCAKN